MLMEPKFVDRAEELKFLEELAAGGFYPVLYVYGPEGCGKTRLLRELYSRIRGREGFTAVYVDAQAAGSVRNAVYGPPEAVRLIAEAAAELAGPPGRAAALALLTALKRMKAL